MVAFFIPHAADAEQAEQVYEATRQFNDAPEGGPRIRALSWYHNGQHNRCEVGSPVPRYFGTGEEEVIAIFDCGQLYKVCTASRGVIGGEAILAGKDHRSHATPFDPE